MISFAKFVAVLSACFLAVTALPGNADDEKPLVPPLPRPPIPVTPASPRLVPGTPSEEKAPIPGPRRTPGKKMKKPSSPDEEVVTKKRVDVPVIRDNPSKGLIIPYFSNDSKRLMNFRIGVATRLDDNHVEMKDLQIETFDESEKHEMDINVPTSILDTDTSVITSHYHVTIRRADFELTGECMIFNSVTKQGALGGFVHMLIYNLDDETGESSHSPQPKEK